ncbi:MAG TPA: hypothetical protein VFC87_01745 [Perlabentimonas sp.]|nr:hypothetical protein [Perlabentimonas sp.]
MKRNKSLHGMVINQDEYIRMAKELKDEFTRESGVNPTRKQLCELFTEKYGGEYQTNYNRLTRFKI